MQALQYFKKHYHRPDRLLILLDNPQHSWQSELAQKQLNLLLEALQQTQLIKHISNPFNVPLNLEPKPFKTQPRQDNQIAQQGHVIMLSLTLTANAQQTPKQLHQHISQLQQVLATYAKPAGYQFYLNGELALNWQYMQVLKHDISWFLPVILLIFILICSWVIKQRYWSICLLIQAIISLTLTLGIAAFAQLTLAAISAFIIIIVMSLTLAYGGHLYFDWQRYRQQNNAHLLALSASLQHNRLAITLGSITTSIGFGLLYLSQSPAIQDFGILVAFAVLINLLLSFTLLPALLSHSNVNSIQQKNFFEKLQCKPPTIINRRYLSAAILLISIAALVPISQLKFDDDPLAYFAQDNPFRISTTKIEQHFTGINQLHYVVDSGQANGIIAPQYISFINQLRRYLTQQPQVIKVDSIVDWIKAYGLGSQQLHNLLPQLHDTAINQELNQDANASVISLYLAPMTAKQLLSFTAKTQQWLTANAPYRVSPALSQQLVFAQLSIHNAQIMLQAMLASLLLLTGILLLLQRSLKVALMALLLNGLPLLWGFAIWQYVGGSLSLGCAVVMGMIFGIMVDDTLHLILKNKLQQRPSLALLCRRTETILPAISFTSFTLISAFSLGQLSNFGPILEISLLATILLSLAWWFDAIGFKYIYALFGEVD